MSIVYFTAFNIDDLITLGQVGARNIMFPMWYLKKIIGKKKDNIDEKFAGLKKQFDKVGVFVKTEQYNEKLWNFCKNNCDEFIDLQMSTFAGIVDFSTSKTGTAIRIRKEERFDTEQSYKIAQNYINHFHKIYPLRQVNGLDSIGYLLWERKPSIDITVFTWTSTAQYLHCTVYDNKTRDLDTIDFRSDKKYTDIESKLQLTKYFYQYKNYFNKCGIDSVEEIMDARRETLLKLPFAVYYMPICQTLNCLEQNFK